jgi:hypothetical protein
VCRSALEKSTHRRRAARHARRQSSEPQTRASSKLRSAGEGEGRGVGRRARRRQQQAVVSRSTPHGVRAAGRGPRTAHAASTGRPRPGGVRAVRSRGGPGRPAGLPARSVSRCCCCAPLLLVTERSTRLARARAALQAAAAWLYTAPRRRLIGSCAARGRWQHAALRPLPASQHLRPDAGRPSQKPINPPSQKKDSRQGSNQHTGIDRLISLVTTNSSRPEPYVKAVDHGSLGVTLARFQELVASCRARKMVPTKR